MDEPKTENVKPKKKYTLLDILMLFIILIQLLTLGYILYL